MKVYPAIIFLGLLFSLSQASVAQQNESNWPDWRGPLETGAAINAHPPVEFSDTINLKWKLDIPGKGHATPIVWGDQMIILTAVATDIKGKTEEEDTEEEGMGRRAMSPNQTDLIHEYRVISVNKNTGDIQWETTVIEEMPLERTHKLGSWASNSPVTDGELIYAYFGSRGLFCLDFEGKILWKQDWGQMEKVMSFGEGSSPAVYGDIVVVVWDHEGQSLISAMDKKTGEEIWIKDREERSSWSTPLILDVNGKAQVITSATNKIRSYDLETGDIVWESTGMTRNVIPNPVYADGILYLMSGYRGTALQAIDLAKAEGDITDSEAMLWQYNQDTPYTPCPLLMDGKLYFLRNNNGFLSCLDAKTGDPHYSKVKIEGIGNLYSSPTGADGKIYIAADGIVVVIRAGEQYELLSSTNLDDTFHASPVIIGNDLFLRGFKSLYCFTEK
ncbi:MAG: PQQ-binding-like beta-propeller repeat protein [Bacteroidetes bacterium]|jgi:outer membrane protein assembly factor BamB|nr:PQQ-binding-like beta-propeller repeat protein [Bacteroidota bacterium]MBT3751537.1 PQQ-binding-like beta-propeller repeat protein [Bacteroidota bacterium]MBT4402208.1 PQQ-binding-like beta-propeller repeat protein [Bacteroidota bacterium]MBT4411320.1 PQQ-binding-like beta-propeller repeat protein [Bacteroidota bacterium]MBT5427469.1 PQQ-binding-like beta-propeller repeat protein [Bacteroidota bacterium]